MLFLLGCALSLVGVIYLHLEGMFSKERQKVNSAWLPGLWPHPVCAQSMGHCPAGRAGGHPLPGVTLCSLLHPVSPRLGQSLL